MTIVLANITNSLRTSTMVESKPQKRLIAKHCSSSGIEVNKNNSDNVSLNSVDLQERNRFRENLLDFSDTALKKNRRDDTIWDQDQTENTASDNEEDFFDSISSPSLNQKTSKVIKVPASKYGSPNLSMSALSNFHLEENLPILQQPSNIPSLKTQTANVNRNGNDVIPHSYTHDSLASERPLNDNIGVDQLETEKINTDKQTTNGVNLSNENSDISEHESENGSIMSERPLACLCEDEERKESESQILTCNTMVRFNEEVSYFDGAYYEEEEEIISNTAANEDTENINDNTEKITDFLPGPNLEQEEVQTDNLNDSVKKKQDISTLITLNAIENGSGESKAKIAVQTNELSTATRTPPALLLTRQSVLKVNPSTSITATVVNNDIQTQNSKLHQKGSRTPERSRTGTIRSNYSNSMNKYTSTHQNDPFLPPSTHRAAYSSVASAYSQPSSVRSSSALTSRRYAKYQNYQMEYFESTRHSIRRKDLRRSSILQSPSNINNNAAKSRKSYYTNSNRNSSFTDLTSNGRYCDSVRDHRYDMNDDANGFSSGRGSALSSRRAGASEPVSRNAEITSMRKEVKNPKRKLSSLRLFRSFTNQDNPSKATEVYKTTTNGSNIYDDTVSRMSHRTRMSRISSAFNGLDFQIFSTPGSRLKTHGIDHSNTTTATSISSNFNRNGTSSGTMYTHRASRIGSRQASRKSSALFFRVDEEERKERIEKEDMMKKKLNSDFFNTVNSLKAHYQADHDFDYNYHSTKFLEENKKGIHKSRSDFEVANSVTIFWKKIKHFF